MRYLDVDEARTRREPMLVLTEGVAGPWGEAANLLLGGLQERLGRREHVEGVHKPGPPTANTLPGGSPQGARRISFCAPLLPSVRLAQSAWALSCRCFSGLGFVPAVARRYMQKCDIARRLSFISPGALPPPGGAPYTHNGV